jgi:superfamily II DNA helicase RecQ
MCLKHPDFRKLLSSVKFSQTICAIIVDEAHCITQWGPQFRPEYADLGNIRAFAPHAPVLITSATLTPSSLDHARKIMQVEPLSSYHVMLGVDRSNIAWYVKRMTCGKDIESLQFIIPPLESESNSPDTRRQLIPTMVFFDDISLAMSSMVYLRGFLPQMQHHEIAVYNSRRTPRAKKRVMKLFHSQEIKILLTTDAAGMVSVRNLHVLNF